MQPNRIFTNCPSPILILPNIGEIIGKGNFGFV